MTEMTIFNVQRAINQKLSKPDLQFSFSADSLKVVHIRVKYITETVIFNVQRPITQKVITGKPLMVLVFYMSSYVALHFCKASRKSLKPFSNYRKGTNT